MTFIAAAWKKGLALGLTVVLLAGCASADPDPATPASPGPTTPPQYGTPFTGVPRPEDAVIYQVNMRAFSASGNFAGVTARLDSIRALGANVVYLLPIYPVGTLRAVNSPYCVKDYQAVNPEFGSLADLRALVDGAHARGMAVMLDWVANHTSWDHPWITAHPDWYLQNAAGTILSPPNTPFTDVAQLNFNNSAMRQAMISAMKSWVYVANVDGFRCDYADAPPADFWRQANDTLRHIASHRLLMLAEGTHSNLFSSGFDYIFGFNFYGALRAVYRNGTPASYFDALNNSESAGTTGGQQVVRYITNHDVNGSDGTPVSLFGGQTGALSAFVVAALYKGVPMIYNGQEAGMTTAITFPFTSVKVRWGQHADITRAYQQLLAARTASTALRTGVPTSYSTDDVCAFTKTAANEQALVIVNVRNASTSYAVPAALANSTWTDALRGGAVSLGIQLTLPPYGYLVLKR